MVGFRHILPGLTTAMTQLESAVLTKRFVKALTMDLVVEVYWSFRSPYSYIVLPRIRELRGGECR
jgi:hypothetical protein